MDIKNSKIKALELDIEYMESQIQMKDKQMREIRDTYESRERQFEDTHRKLQEANFLYT